MVKHLPLLFLLFFCSLRGQYIDYEASLNLQSLSSIQEHTPFWMHSNQRGRIDELTTLAGWAGITGRYSISKNTYLESGLGAAFQNGYEKGFRMDAYFLRLRTRRWRFFIGRRQKEEIYGGLSASNQNILWSLHARPLPGVGVELYEPIILWERGGLGFRAAWEEYITEGDRYVDDIRVHHKSFHLVWDKVPNLKLTVGLQHFVQWGGYSPEFGSLPKRFRDYMDVLIGNEGEEDLGGQEANALGNHLGSYEVYLNTSVAQYELALIYNTLFEDNSGRVLGNTPDGRYGVFIRDTGERIPGIHALMYEFYFTRDQSENTPTGDGKDNYFNNNLYRSGWTYEHRILGAPFFLLDSERFRIAHNTIRVHHLGISGTAYREYPFKFLLSYRENFGVKGGQEEPFSRIFSTFLNIQVWSSLFNIHVLTGADIFLDGTSNAGLGIRLHRSFF